MWISVKWGGCFCKGCGSAVEQEKISEQTKENELGSASINQQQNSQINEISEQTNPVHQVFESTNQNVNNQSMDTQPTYVNGQIGNNFNNQANPIHQEFGVPNQNINNQAVYGQQPMYQQQPQPMYNSQPQYGYNQPMNMRQGNNKIVPIVIGVVAVVIVALLIFFIGKGINNGDGGSILGGGNDSGYKVNFNGFSFNIPTNLIYETSSDSLNITNQSGTWIAAIEVIDGMNYSQIQGNKGQLKSGFESIGFTTNNLAEKTYSGANFITIEATKGGVNYILGVSEANSMNLFGITTATENNNFDYSVVKTIAPILKSATYTGESANAKVKDDIKIKDALNFMQEQPAQ